MACSLGYAVYIKFFIWLPCTINWHSTGMNFGNIIRAKTSWSGLADPSMPGQHRLLPADAASSKRLPHRFSGSSAKHCSALAAWRFGEWGYPSLSCLAAPGCLTGSVCRGVGAPWVPLEAAAPSAGPARAGSHHGSQIVTAFCRSPSWRDVYAVPLRPWVCIWLAVWQLC